MSALQLLLPLLLVEAALSAGSINYADQSTWGGICVDPASKKQSPINVVPPAPCTRLGDTIIDLPVHAQTVKAINADKDYTVEFGFGDANITYNVPGKDTLGKAVQVHLHWGATDATGSEHTLYGTQHSAEMHMVTGYMVGEDTVYAAIGRFFKVGEENEEIGKMITAMEAAASTEERNIASFNLTALYPPTIDLAYAYAGSLTTPTCDEKVWHVVVPELLTMSAAQLAKLRTLKLGADPSTGSAVTRNWRDLQDLNGRTIHCYSAATSLLTSPLLVAAAFLLYQL